ncbi:TATA box-binding protein-associated factor RNA polymerase I subunit A isoform X2 [Bombina bombina]|uniref:TATA box-binding protein-associated factor RNA polymerase I subunit A isoform X2 n=1 Tax=Bombina bombina TaxID=8345 RepID=UPI00235B2856|nr:TATA box-binding protein-associated factor RNA polymerase I subunit A isoform X2 [Bombina bombina]XP_053568502.1 TATA box-binding protein-associated factor RNA polymerase I subunit A isoform X2 [Bombina bombina]
MWLIFVYQIRLYILQIQLIWRLGNETLLHHPKATPEDINFFNERMKNIGVKNYLSISLEHVFYLLCNDMTEEAYRNLSMVESWRYGSLSVSQEKYIKLIQAYRALLDYHKWLDKKAGVIDQDFASQASADQNLSSLYRQATASFQEIIKVPGVWDPFVLSYVDLLESSGKHKQAEELLTDYAYNSKYPSNPNAHVYLYEFLKRNEASEDHLIKVLKVFYLQVPSHKLMLEFVKLLEQSESEEHNQLAVEVIFNILDFSGWKSEVNAWHCLVKQLKKSFRRRHKSWILEEWQSRKRWWPAYHFNKFHVKKDWKNDINLAIHKALVAGTLLGQDCRYFAAVCSLGSESPNKNITSMLKFVKHHSSSNPD